MTVTADQIAKAKAKGLINVEALAVACDKYAFPFYLAATILDKETDGHNIFGHDAGGSFSGPPNVNIEVTEARYKEFRRQIDSGKTSNGVGPMQLTWKGYFPDAEDKGYRLWLPADNIAYGIGHILKPSLAANLRKGMSLEKAFWASAKSYNGNTSYADDAVARAKTWKAAVGTADMEPTPTPGDGMALTEADWNRLKAMIEQVVTSPSVLTKLAAGVWMTDGIIPAGKTESDSKNTAWKPATFLRLTYDEVADLIRKP